MHDLRSSVASATRVGELLIAGGTAVVPAEGVYGLVGSAARPDAIARLLQLKGRENTRPMLVLTPSTEAALRMAVEMPEPLQAAGRAGKAVTFLLPARENVPFGLVGPERLVGVRLPADDFGRTLTEAAGLVVSTSANRSGEPTPCSLDEVPAEIKRRVDAVVDGGTLIGLPSTVAKWEGRRLVVVREGAVDRGTLAALTGLEVE